MFRRPFPVLPSLFLTAGWIILALLGFPAPTIDDLFYAGPSVHLAAGGGLANPWLGVLDPVGGRFFVYPPLSFPIVALWLKLFGVGTRSLLLFQAAAAAAVTLVGLHFLRRWNAPVWIAAAWTLLLAALAGLSGLRPDACSLALFSLGLALDTGLPPERSLARLPGLAFLLAGVQSLPALAPWCLGYLLFRLLSLPGPRRAGFAGACLAALGLNLLLFFCAIGFRPSAFFHDLAACQANHFAANRRFYADVWRSPAFLFRLLSLPLACVVAGSLALRLERRSSPLPPEERARHLRLLTLGMGAGLLALALAFLFVARSVSTIRLIGLVCAGGTILFAAKGQRLRRHPLWPCLGATAALIFLGCYGRGLVEWGAFLSVPGPDPAALARLRAEAGAAKADVLLVDPASARTVFDFRLPPGARDITWDFAWGNPPLAPEAGPASEGRKKAYLLSPQAALYRPWPFPGDARFVAPIPLRVLGREIPRTAANRDAFFLIAD